MYLDTRSYDAMILSVCRVLSINQIELDAFFDIVTNICNKGNYCDGNIVDNEINDFVRKHFPRENIDEILFFHLSRRLNSSKDDFIGENLCDLLTSTNAFSTFLESHNVRFDVVEKNLELYHNESLISLNDTETEGVCYLRGRLGYNSGREDFCYNGFAFKDLLYKNNYTRSLFHGPEFITQLSMFLKSPHIASDYFNNSEYYCVEYCVPLNLVLFDSNDKLTQEEKPVYLLTCILNRLYEYSYTNKRYMFDHSNPILRLKDNETMISEYYSCYEKITHDMIK